MRSLFAVFFVLFCSVSLASGPAVQGTLVGEGTFPDTTTVILDSEGELHSYELDFDQWLFLFEDEWPYDLKTGATVTAVDANMDGDLLDTVDTDGDGVPDFTEGYALSQ